MLTISVGPEAGRIISYIALNPLSPVIISFLLYLIFGLIMLCVIKNREARIIVNVVLIFLAIILTIIMYNVR